MPSETAQRSLGVLDAIESDERLNRAQRDLTLRLLGASEEATETPAPKPAAKKAASAK